MLRVAVALSLIVLAAPASAGVLFDSLDSATARTAGDELEPMFATFSTGSAAVMGDVSLMLSIPFQVYPPDTYTVSLGGGDPLSGLSYYPASGLNIHIGASIDSTTAPMTSLPSSLTVEQFDQFAGISLKPDSLYWIEVQSTAVVDWGITTDVSGQGVASNYLSTENTDGGFFLNNGIEPFPFDNALQMKVEVASVPEPSTWLMFAMGFGGLGLAGIKKAPAKPKKSS
jgi:hypothetical protein